MFFHTLQFPGFIFSFFYKDGSLIYFDNCSRYIKKIGFKVDFSDITPATITTAKF